MIQVHVDAAARAWQIAATHVLDVVDPLVGGSVFPRGSAVCRVARGVPVAMAIQGIAWLAFDLRQQCARCLISRASNPVDVGYEIAQFNIRADEQREDLTRTFIFLLFLHLRPPPHGKVANASPCVPKGSR